MDTKEKIYLTTRQTTENGTAVNIVEVTGTDIKEAILKARIQMAKAIENFKANNVLYAYADVRQLKEGSFIIDRMEWNNLPVEPESNEEE